MKSGWLIEYKDGHQVILTEERYEQYKEDRDFEVIVWEEHWFDIEVCKAKNPTLDVLDAKEQLDVRLAMTLNEFNQIMQIIKEKHSFGKIGHTNWVKYVRPHFDLRDGLCFSIKINEKIFHSNSCKVTMYDDIIQWLERPTPSGGL